MADDSTRTAPLDDSSDASTPGRGGGGFTASFVADDDPGPAPAPPPGYELCEPVGRGGMGVVYRARDVALNRDIAVKFLRARFPADGIEARRFVQEAQITAQLTHPGVPPVHEVGELADGRPFIVMKLVEGLTLQKHLRREPGGRLLGAFEQVCQTVGYAHANGVVHRDLKPSNIMVGKFGEVQVMDWGIAKHVAGPGAGVATVQLKAPAGALETVAGMVKGTPAYMAPEQARGQPVDHRCDLFALGCVLYRMATGRLPFQGDSAYAVIVAVASETPTAPRAVNPDIPPALEALILSLLEKDPADRAQSAADVLAEMRRVAAGVGGDAQVLPSERTTSQAETMEWRGPEPAASRPSKRILVAGLAVVALLALIVVLILGKGPSSPPRESDEPAPPPAIAAASSKSDAETNGKDAEPSTLDAEPPKPELSLIGTWDQVGGKMSFNFQADGKVTGDWGFKGQWGQSGRKFGFSGKGSKGAEVKFKGSIAEDGKSLRLSNPKGGSDAYQRR